MNLFILTGAGISEDSGLSTWRDNNGLWHGQPAQQICSLEAFQKNPEMVCAFYDDRRKSMAQASPNPAHTALAKLQKIWTEDLKGEFTLVTQNVDNLHERAGSTAVIHMHGSAFHAMCVECGWQGQRHGVLEHARDCAICRAEALRPDIVFFGEAPRQMPKIEAALLASDIFVSIGTSGAVYPAAGFIETAFNNGTFTVHVNLDPPERSEYVSLAMVGRATEMVPECVEQILRSALPV